MACIRRRRGKWVLDYRDATGRRCWETYDTRGAAEEELERALGQKRRPKRSSADANITLSAYWRRWVQEIQPSLKTTTIESYEWAAKHALPILGHLKVRAISRPHVKQLLVEKMRSLARDSVRTLHAALHACLAEAVEDEIIAENPATLGRSLKSRSKAFRLTLTTAERQERVKAMTADQLRAFEQAAPTAASPRSEAATAAWPMFYIMARTGLRLGEAAGLQWDDPDFNGRQIRVARAVSKDGKRIETPKSGRSRLVDMSASVRDLLLRLDAARKAEALRQGVPVETLTAWVFHTRGGRPLDHSNVERAFKRVLKAAGLPLHLSPHSLRHTYASLLLQQGESPAYVQEQLGHTSINMTVDTYGKWLPRGNPAVVDRLDQRIAGGSAEASGSKVVANGHAGVSGATRGIGGSRTSVETRGVRPTCTR